MSGGLRDSVALAGRSTAPAALVRDDALRARLAGRPALLLLDVDGTLAPLAPTPEAARVPDETLRAVEALVRAPHTHVSLVSGRAALDALGKVPVPGLWAVGNHGFETIAPDGTVEVDPLVAPHVPGLRAAAAALADAAAPWPGARLEDKQLTLTLHYRLAAADALPALRAAAEEQAGRHGLVVSEGKTVIEIRPPAPVDKGSASLALAVRLGVLEPGASVLFAGDDVTDEDGFRALRGATRQAVTIRVGHVPEHGTFAEYRAPTLPEFRELLEWLVALRSS